MKRLIALAGLAVAATTVQSMAAEWSEVRETVVPLQFLMTSMLDDVNDLRVLFGDRTNPLELLFDLDVGNLSYELPVGTMIDGSSVSLSGSLTQVDGTTWVGSSELSLMRSTYGKTFEARVVRDTGNGRDVEFEIVRRGSLSGDLLRHWQVDWFEGKSTGTSRHYDANGALNATDNLTRLDNGNYVWRVQEKGKVSIYGTLTSDLPTSGSASFIIPTPSSVALLGLGAIMCVRRRR